MADIFSGLDWHLVPWVIAGVLMLDRLWSAAQRLAAVPGEIRRKVAEADEKIHEAEERERALTKLAEYQSAILALLRPDGGMSLWDRVDKLDKDFRAYVEDAQRANRTIIGHLEDAPRGDAA